MSKTVFIHQCSMAALIRFSRADFADFKAFNQAKTQRIHQHRLGLLRQYLATQLQAEDLARTAHGKPYLPAYPDLAFNHSHSQQHYALVMSQRVQDIGVDIEDLARKVRFDALAQHAFDVDEYAHWQACGQDPIYWFKVWTAKEAILKASGLGIRMSLNQLSTGCTLEQDQGSCKHADLGAFAFKHIQTDALMLTVAWRMDDEAVEPALVLIE